MELFTTDKVTNCYVKRCVKYYFTKLKKKKKDLTSLGGNEYIIMLLSSVKMGSLSNNDGDGYENVTSKVNSRCLKL